MHTFTMPINFDFLKNFTFTPLNVLKLTGIALGVLILASIGITILGSVFQTASRLGGVAMPSFIEPGAPSYGKEMAEYDYAVSDGIGGRAQLSARNVAGSMPYPYPQPGSTGDTAEEFEVTQYNASFESRDKMHECSAVAGLKDKDYVVFENANEGDHECSYTFKVKHDRVVEVLAFVKDLGPRDMSENTYTIKNQIDDFTSEIEILKKKMATVDETLSSALKAYDEIQRVATQSQNADALARVIDSKIQLIERLTQERINVNEQLDRYARMKSEQLDRLDYTYFYVNVYERSFIDGESLADSWKEGVRQFVQNLNKSAQDLTINLLYLIVLAIQYILYILILVVIVKYVWRIAVYIWNK